VTAAILTEIALFNATCKSEGDGLTASIEDGEIVVRIEGRPYGFRCHAMLASEVRVFLKSCRKLHRTVSQ
jgi:hypothetical protein